MKTISTIPLDTFLPLVFFPYQFDRHLLHGVRLLEEVQALLVGGPLPHALDRALHRALLGVVVDALVDLAERAGAQLLQDGHQVAANLPVVGAVQLVL